MIVVNEDQLERVMGAIKIAACTGNPGDGKRFVSNLVESRTIHHES
jgi:nitrogen regulatory protein PII